MRRDRKKLQRKVTNFGVILCQSSRGLALGLSLILCAVLVCPNISNAQVSATTSVTQGQSKQGKKLSKWNGSFQWVVQKNQDYYSDYFSGLNVGLSYAYNPKLSFYFETGYSQPISDNYEKVDRYGFTDLELGVNTAPFYKNKYNFQVSATSSITLPTSEISQKASLNASWNGGLVTTTPLQRGFRVSTVHLVSLNSYTYETSNKMGTAYNYPYATSNILSVSWSHKQFYTVLSGTWSYLKNYAGTDINVQAMRAGMGYNFPKKVRAEVFGRWQDQVLTNNSVFDDDKTFFGMILTVNI